MKEQLVDVLEDLKKINQTSEVLAVEVKLQAVIDSLEVKPEVKKGKAK